MKVLLLNGGGLDSLALGIILKHSGHEVKSVHVDFGYPNAAALKLGAESIATTYCDSHQLVTVSGMDAVGLTDIYPRYRPVQYQQLVLASVGAALAQQHKQSFLVAGCRHNLWSKNFRPMFTALLKENQIPGMAPIDVQYPLENFTDDEVYNVIKDSPILHDTASCLTSPVCGTCHKCEFRAAHNI